MTPDAKQPTSYWYRLLADRDDQSLEQGDVLFGFRYLVPTAYVTLAANSDEDSLTQVKSDVVVLTASCDLERSGRVDFVLLCPHWDFDEAAKNQAATGVKPGARENIEKGFQPRYCLLSRCDFPGCAMGVRVVDFNRVFPIPRKFINDHTRSGVPRLRMNPPYREHLAQAFGNCYSRIGLPLRATATTAPPTSAQVPASPLEAPTPFPQS